MNWCSPSFHICKIWKNEHGTLLTSGAFFNFFRISAGITESLTLMRVSTLSLIFAFTFFAGASVASSCEHNCSKVIRSEVKTVYISTVNLADIAMSTTYLVGILAVVVIDCLPGNQTGVKPALLDQFQMSALINNLSIFDHCTASRLIQLIALVLHAY